MDAQVLKRRFNVGEFHQMAEVGIFGEGDRVELLAGEVVETTPIGSRHAGAVDRLNRILSSRLAPSFIVRVQNPVRLDEHSEPQPDLAVLRFRSDFYAEAHPGPGDVLVVVEVADTSAELDRALKVPLYARAGIPEVWLVDLPAQAVDLYRQASAEGYREHRRLAPGDRLTASQVPALNVAVAELLG